MTMYMDAFRKHARVGAVTARCSHLTVGPGDDLEELHAFAALIGLRRSRCEGKPRPRAHHDVTSSKRQQALAAGLVPVTWRESARQRSQAMVATWQAAGEGGAQ